jgi:hypothetical protein
MVLSLVERKAESGGYVIATETASAEEKSTLTRCPHEPSKNVSIGAADGPPASTFPQIECCGCRRSG